MLNGLDSPHSDLQKLLDWLNLEETREVIKHLQDKTNLILREVLAPPTKHVLMVNGIAHPMDGVTREQLHQRFIGIHTGLNEFLTLLEDRQIVLRQRIAELDKNNNPNNQS